MPLVVADIIDTGIASGDSGYLVRRCLLLIGLGLLGLAASVTAQYFAAKAAIGFTAGVRHAVFQKVQSLSYAELDRLGTSTLMTRMTKRHESGADGTQPRAAAFAAVSVCGIRCDDHGVHDRCEIRLGLAVIIPLLFAVVFAIMFSCIPLYRRVQGRLDGVLGAAKENLAGVRVIRAFGKERQEVESFEEKSGALLSSQLFVGKISALLNPVTYVMINLAIIAVLRTGAGQVDKGILTQGAGDGALQLHVADSCRADQDGKSDSEHDEGDGKRKAGGIGSGAGKQPVCAEARPAGKKRTRPQSSLTASRLPILPAARPR